MQQFTTHTGKVASLPRDSVDTDQIIPKQFLTSLDVTGYGQFLFDAWRYLDHGQLGMDCSTRQLNDNFELNNPMYRDSSILVTGDNFGCGSSREHAVWALMEYGFRVVISTEFAAIFKENAARNGLLLIEADAEYVQRLHARVATESCSMTVDLPNQLLKLDDDSESEAFAIDSQLKMSLVEGLDDLDRSLAFATKIREFEQARRQAVPWLFNR